MTTDLVIILALILLNGFFSMSEMAVVTSRPARLRQMAQTSRGARMALQLAERPERFLSAVQIGITLVGVLTGALGGIAVADDVAGWLAAIPGLAAYAHPVAVAVSVTGITFATLVLGELVPKRLALTRPELIASRVAPPMRVIAAVTRPFIAVLAFSTRLVLRLLGLRDGPAQTVTEDEIRLLVAEGAEQGVIDANERNMVNRVLRLGDRDVESLMTPRTDIVWLDADAGTEANLAVMREVPHSRFPVRRGSDDRILGIFESKRVVELPDLGNGQWLAHLRPPLYLPETTPVLRALEKFREEDMAFALVVDEYGDLQGLVTSNDVLDAIVGNRASAAGDGNAGDSELPIVQREHGGWLVDGRLATDDLRELLGVSALPGEEEHDFHSAAGMLIAHFDRIPAVGEAFEWRDWRFEVVDLDGARIDKLLIEPLPGPAATHALP
ncbi:hemolysin family protein [Pseudofulvimonas gallinarii]|jgi:putative hemolysin|uniref:Putative hemolysin n=1 Tax=Pseudofulvimonas gallinarii TaxID=634155 RepID=A0A4S3KW84_9GAMM|nr:hemolysin family protein [Pseudofulvimonas gallinarii]TCT00772.1 putative hemolysin [Pseudofulvimonas gallinarii]THD12808.1 hemolysin [Pseudofulvimonas gallinarii]